MQGDFSPNITNPSPRRPKNRDQWLFQEKNKTPAGRELPGLVAEEWKSTRHIFNFFRSKIDNQAPFGGFFQAISTDAYMINHLVRRAIHHEDWRSGPSGIH